jgi:predicted DNA-binding transcriptional regulator AlpA
MPMARATDLQKCLGPNYAGTSLPHVAAQPVKVDTSRANRFLTAKQVAKALGLHVATVWAGVGSGRLPRPVYPAPRSPRWCEAELLAALERTRALPREAMAARRAARVRRRRTGDAAPAIEPSEGR